ncbi:hypothetical protein GMRT_10795 [Giardia muris]|uniref:Uncharacterized protein n=1 Tax=Giardia muris TaxID=5742 RepID=A0A4Z1SNV6_GIAMU|nr:hypothetical protein GMRT_10795 [Giardia muris]|eukprot:TNJ27492.1 hypothetical protein GMRT_10795 [Giardia muris]
MVLCPQDPTCEESEGDELGELIRNDNLAALIAHDGIAFQLRCREELLIEYLQTPTTLAQLLTLIFRDDCDQEEANCAITVVQACENISQVLSVITDTPGLLSIPFDSLRRHSTLLPRGHYEVPRRFQHISRSFGQVLKSLMWSTKRLLSILSFLRERREYLALWLQMACDSYVMDAFSFLLYDSSRKAEIAEEVARFVCDVGIIDVVAANIVDVTISTEYAGALAQLLCVIVIGRLPAVAEQVHAQLPRFLSFLLETKFTEPEAQSRIEVIGDLILCCMSMTCVQEAGIYNVHLEELNSLSEAVVGRRREELERCYAGSDQPQLTPLGIAPIDDYEKMYFPIHVALARLCQRIPHQLEILQGRFARSVSFGVVVLLRLAARVLSIAADVRNSLAPRRDSFRETFNSIILTDPYSYSPTTPAALPDSGDTGAGGAPDISFVAVVQAAGVPLGLGVVHFARAFVSCGLHRIAVQMLEKFPNATCVHYLASRILMSLIEYGPVSPDVCLATIETSGLLRELETISFAAYQPPRDRNSRVVHVILVARFALRTAFGVPDEGVLLSKLRKLDSHRIIVPGCRLTEPVAYPMSLSTATTFEERCVFPELLRLLRQSHAYVMFSRVYLEIDERVDAVFSEP